MKPAITTGEILLEDYLVPMSFFQNVLTRTLAINQRSINEIILAHSSITLEMSLRPGELFNQSSCFWCDVRTTYNFRQLRKRKGKLAPL